MNYDFRGGLFRVLRVTLLVLLLIGAAVWLRGVMTSLKSEQAVINAEIIQIRTPITGELRMRDIRPGMLLKRGDPLFTVANSRFGDRESVSQHNALVSQVETLRAEILGAQNALGMESLSPDKNRKLFATGLIARMVVEESQARCDNARSQIKAKTEQLARTEVRVEEMAEQSALQKESVVTMPEDGLIWSVAGKPGEQMDANKLVLEVINPARIWVDAFFTERHARDLRPGLTAQIASLDSESAWNGSLESVRAGVGRFAYDTTVAVPPPEMVKRQIAVRVAAAWDKPFGPEAFYGVGRSVEVTFLKGTAQRTQADVLRERCEQALGRLRGKLASR